MPKKYRIKLSKSEHQHLEKITKLQRVAASKKQRARIFLLSDENRESGPLKDTEISERVGMSLNSIERLRKQCHEMGPLETLERKKRVTPPRPAIIDGELEARLIAEACSEPPEGHARWTLRLLADRLVELDLVEDISYETVRVALKKTNFNLTGKNTGASLKSETLPS
jgi:transposase